MEQVRTAVPDDIETMASFQVAMALETENLDLDKQTVTDGIAAVMKDASKGIYYVVEDKEVLASLLITSEWSDWRNGYVWWIQSVYVHRDHRGKGLYKKMYNHVKALATESDKVKGIRLYVDNTNIDAQKTYAALGMSGDHYRVFEWMK